MLVSDLQSPHARACNTYTHRKKSHIYVKKRGEDGQGMYACMCPVSSHTRDQHHAKPRWLVCTATMEGWYGRGRNSTLPHLPHAGVVHHASVRTRTSDNQLGSEQLCVGLQLVVVDHARGLYREEENHGELER